MLATTAILPWVILATQAETRNYRDDKLGLIFQYPREWTLRKERLYSVLEWTTTSGAKVRVQIMNSNFRAPKEDWQRVQKDVNVTNKREVLRQWEEELLGVPILLTSAQYSEGAGPERLLIGLLYSKTPEKFMFRLTAPADAAEEAEKQWRNAILTLRTTSGTLPTIEDPDSPTDPVKPPSKPEKVITLKPTDGKPAKIIKAPLVTKVTAIGQSVNVFTPEGWTIKEQDSQFVMTHPQVKGTVIMEIGNITEAAARTYLLTSSSKSLSRFESVASRHETNGAYNQAGFWICQVWRVGKAAGGDLVVSQSIGTGAGIYWLVTHDTKGEADFKADGELLKNLYHSMSLEFAT